MFRRLLALATIGLVLFTAGCGSAADTASHNVSKMADNFEIQRRIVFVNGITDKYLLVIEGRCSLGNADKPRELTVTCKVGEGQFVKHFLGISDNVTYVVEQTAVASVSEFRYKVNFRPEGILPDIDLQTS